MPDARTTDDRPGVAAVPRRPAAVPGPARPPKTGAKTGTKAGAKPGAKAGNGSKPGPGTGLEPVHRPPEPRAAGGQRPGSRPAPRAGGGSAPHRLTAVGGAVVMLGATLLGGAADFWLFGGAGIAMGLVYVATCFQVAVRVRAADLAIAPICGPIAFAATLVLLGAGPDHSFLGRVVGLATALALQAGWLFTGTAVALLIVLARHIALTRARRRNS
ncbi:DUF6542 domain-containing protein [Streptacidiphilus sp. N1-3]|uniref:DUF6542 domain-containing protein n=1 Tax=Streptacidiphilus alkalitolerans TaxID=3342712 RepID=A0ABV6X3B8_9ACTN